MDRSVRVLLGLASVLLVAVVWLAFHDTGEVHTARDWLTLLVAVLVWSATALSFRRGGTIRDSKAGASGA